MLKLVKQSFLALLATGLIGCAYAGEKTAVAMSQKKAPAAKVTMDAPAKKVAPEQPDEITAENNKVQLVKQHMKIAADMQANVMSQETLEATIASLSTQMMKNKKMQTTKAVLITSFVRLDIRVWSSFK